MLHMADETAVNLPLALQPYMVPAPDIALGSGASPTCQLTSVGRILRNHDISQPTQGLVSFSIMCRIEFPT